MNLKFSKRWVAASFAVLTLMANTTQAVDKKEGWDTSLAVGFNLTSGNSDTLLATVRINTEREWEKDIWRLGAGAALGKSEGDTTTERADAGAEYQHLFTERVYGGLRADALHDGTADLSYRFTVGPSVGYYFIKTDLTRLSGEIGPSFVAERIGGENSSYCALRLGERFDRKLSATAKVWQTIEVLPQIDDFDNYLANFEVGIEAALNNKLSLRVVFQDKYDNQPAAGKKHNDMAVISSLVYKF